MRDTASTAPLIGHHPDSPRRDVVFNLFDIRKKYVPTVVDGYAMTTAGRSMLSPSTWTPCRRLTAPWTTSTRPAAAFGAAAPQPHAHSGAYHHVWNARSALGLPGGIRPLLTSSAERTERGNPPPITRRELAL